MATTVFMPVWAGIRFTAATGRTRFMARTAATVWWVGRTRIHYSGAAGRISLSFVRRAIRSASGSTSCAAETAARLSTAPDCRAATGSTSIFWTPIERWTAIRPVPSAAGLVRVVNMNGASVVHGSTDSDRHFEFELIVEDGGELASNCVAADFVL